MNALLPKAPLSPRRRRLRWTLAALATGALVGLAVGWPLYLKARPRPYRPDEASANITRSLARNLPAEAPTPRFVDVTSAAGLAAFRTFAGQRTSQLPEDMGAGVAWGDFDNDGYDDVFLVSAGGPLNAPEAQLAPSELYHNLGNGTFQRVEGFPETRIHGMGAAWGDYDGDGFLDLVVSGYNALRLFHNEGGSGRFVRDTRFPEPKGFWSSATWGDYDNDRNLDLYVCGYVQYAENEADRARTSLQIGTAVPYTLNPSSYAPAANLLFHNRGDGTFREVAQELGVQDREGRSLGALWHDFDDDGWLDLYVANDVSDNVLYHNLGGRFEDISHAACVADYRSGMGLAAGDYDHDGDDDLFIGHWVGQENALYDNLWADFHRQPPGGTNAPPGKSYGLRFTDVADMRGVGQIALPYVSWGAAFEDFDGDTWPDLVVANGNTLEAEGPPPKKLKPQEAFLFWNQHGNYFHNLAPLNAALSQPHVSRGLAVADYDNDGAMDILISFLGEGVQLLRNQMQTGHWLKVRLRSRGPSGAATGFGDGCKVIAHVGGVALRRTVSSVSYLSQNSHTLHFGLGPATQVDRLEVRWLGGGTNYYTNLAANSTWQLIEGDPHPVILRLQNSATTDPRTAATTGGNPAVVPGNPQPSLTEKERVVAFWGAQRMAVNAMKVEHDNLKAIHLFCQALALDPNHEDSRYYLAQCLAAAGDPAAALAQLDELIKINPNSHRGFQQWGVLRALSARNRDDLAAAERSLERAHALNPEETGALLVLGEISLLRGEVVQADERLAAACRTNPKAVGGFWLRGYLAWRRGDPTAARALLEQSRQALGKDWQPRGTTSEGDVARQQYVATTPLARFWERWDGTPTPEPTYTPLAQWLREQGIKEARQ